MLLSLLLDFESLFDGTLGDWNRPPVSIEMKDGAKPYHGRPYPIPQIHKATLMKEIDRLMGIGVLKRQSSSQWASLTFIIPKKDMTVRTITRGSGPSLPAKMVFLGRETTFSDAQKTPRKQTDAEQREPFF